MAIALNLRETETNLFCASKWWGDPDMPSEMEYPSCEGYPMTFICQINCEYLEKYDPEGLLPHTGMLYFFGAIDELLGYESPVKCPKGEWPKNQIRVKYAKDINFETFQTVSMVGEDGEAVADAPYEIVFSNCEDDDPGLRLLGSVPAAVADEYKNKDHVCVLQLSFGSEEGQRLCFSMSRSDLGFGNWKKCVATLA